MTTNNPDVLQPTRASRAHDERLKALAEAEQVVRDLSAVYGGDPILKKDVLDAVAFALGCSQETAQSYVDALCSIHPRAPFLNCEIGRKVHVAIKDPQLLNEDANLSASQAAFQEEHKEEHPPVAKEGAGRGRQCLASS